jgi:hypothetical protein
MESQMTSNTGWQNRSRYSDSFFSRDVQVSFLARKLKVLNCTTIIFSPKVKGFKLYNYHF